MFLTVLGKPKNVQFFGNNFFFWQLLTDYTTHHLTKLIVYETFYDDGHTVSTLIVSVTCRYLDEIWVSFLPVQSANTLIDLIIAWPWCIKRINEKAKVKMNTCSKGCAQKAQ